LQLLSAPLLPSEQASLPQLQLLHLISPKLLFLKHRSSIKEMKMNITTRTHVTAILAAFLCTIATFSLSLAPELTKITAMIA
jgi:hypothetical protein